MSFRLLAVALVATFAAATPAAAATITYQDVFDPAGSRFMTADSAGACIGVNNDGVISDSISVGECSTLSFSMALAGYSSPPNVLQTATLTINLPDGPDADTETFSLTGDLSPLWTNLSVIGGGNPSAPISVFAQVLGDGMVNLLLTATTGDFHFDWAVLDATWLDRDEPEVPPVPEPASLLLLGAGAIAVAYQVRKAKRS